MQKLDLEAKERSRVGKRSRGLLAMGLIPAIVYGKGMNATPIEIEEKVFTKFISSVHSKNIIINLKVGANAMPVLMHEVQKDLLSKRVRHIDFHRILMDEAIKTKVPVVLLGESAGVKSDGGILVHPLREIEVKAMPADIPARIEIDIAALKIGEAIHVSNLKAIPGVEFLNPAQDIIVSVASPTKEEEVAPVVAAEAVAVAGAPEAAGVAAPGAAVPAAEAGKKAPEAGKKEAAPAAKTEKPKK